MSKTDIIEISNLIKVYKQKNIEVIALRGVDLKVQREEILGIMGPSGSGKTTLLNQIGAIDRPTGGIIISCGKDLSKLNDNELTSYRRFDVGFVFQEFNLSPVLTAEENIRLPMKLTKKLTAEEQKLKARELLKRVNLSSRANHKPDELSGGEKQRIALLTAIVNEPRILIADEPTGELDSETSTEILELLKELQSEYGLTCVIVTHNQLVSRITDRVLQLADGRIKGTYKLNITDTEEPETPSFEFDAGIALKHLYPPRTCENCQNNEFDYQEPSEGPEIYARSSSGMISVQMGFGICKKCNHISWGFSPTR
ncbi:MAG: ABC transporter ATP-binding protein [Candidatus Odinarchaeota archaeon]